MLVVCFHLDASLMPSLTRRLSYAVFQEAEIVWGKANQSPCTPCTIWKPIWKRCNVKKTAMTEELDARFVSWLCCDWPVKLGKLYNFSHCCVCEWGLESQLHIVVWIKGLYAKPKHSTCGVFCWIFFYIDPPPPLVRSLGGTIEND